MLSYFGRLAYNFNKKYLTEFTVRRDGSSVFGENVRWATFPSVALGWAFSEESFMERFWWLSYGKIRASWGKQAAVTAILVGAAHSAHIGVKVNSHIRSLLLPFVSAARRMPQYLNPVSAGPWR